MSAQEFKPGDTVRVVKASGSDGNLAIGDEHVVKRVNSAGDVSWGGQVWARERFVKVEPEFVVGQVIKGEDYNRLPVGSKVEMYGEIGKSVGNPQWTKRVDGLWTDQAGVMGANLTETGEPRTLTHLGDGERTLRQNLVPNPAFDTGTDGWSEDDLYVEPEPLKKGDWVQVWARVQGSAWSDGTIPVDLGVSDHDMVFVRPRAIVRPDDGAVPPWLTERPVTVTISGTRVFSEESGAPMVRLETGPGSYALIPIANISSITEGGVS